MGLLARLTHEGGKKMVLSDDHPNCRIETEMRNYCVASEGNLTPLTLIFFFFKPTLSDLILKQFLFSEQHSVLSMSFFILLHVCD